MGGNPTILQLLYVPLGGCVRKDAWGSRLQEIAPHIVSRRAGGAFLGYLQAQRMRFTGERGGSHGIAHAGDREKYGYDTKYAMHMLRLGYQGVELLSTGRLSFPVPEREFLLSVRKGESSTQEILSRTGELEKELKSLMDTSLLPSVPDKEFVEKWMMRVYWIKWKSEAGHPQNPYYDPPFDLTKNWSGKLG